ncbi:hypothetical protein J8N08_13425 [Agrobacterium tumefaciens]|uniref:hypothetical protein n=1 Tax=Agrobacterium tumefaciens TaxID=358 RepID=UPI001BB6310D|nr:hypothetical protein J8N08_13425 [Agrobacterium tumefaciens]
MRKPIARRIRELEEWKKTLQARLDKQERAQSTRGRCCSNGLCWSSWSETSNAVIVRTCGSATT